MESLIVFLNHWQELLSSLVSTAAGGIIGFFAARISANSERKRDQTVCAALLTRDLAVFLETTGEFIENELKSGRSNMVTAYNFIRSRPILSPMFDSSRVRIMSVNLALDERLHRFRMLYDGLMQVADNLALEFRGAASQSAFSTNSISMAADGKKLIDGLGLAREQAQTSLNVLRKLFQSKVDV